LGVITVVAVTLMAVYFGDPKTSLDHVLELILGCAAGIGAVGFMLFRGYDAFHTRKFQRDFRDDSLAALRKFADEITETQEVSERAYRAKQTCSWISAIMIALVEIAVTASRWHGR
jgi:hypothetical protein